MSLVQITCAYCGGISFKRAIDVSRAHAAGLKLFCNRECSGLGRRKNKTREQKVEEKRLYDMKYRARNLAAIKAKKHEHYKRTYDPAKAAIERKARMPSHVAYCQRPEYREYKREYDAQLRAKEYGAFAEAYRILLHLEREILNKGTRYEIDLANGKLNKTTRRKREYAKAVGA